MSYHDDVQELEPHRPTLLLFRCRRCNGLTTEEHDDAAVALRHAIATGRTLIAHACVDGAEGAAELLGTGSGRPRVPMAVPEVTT